MIQSCRNGNRAVPCAEALQYAYYIASGLKAVHDKQIVHRDIKPSNILLGNEPKMLVISDFGYSKPSNAPPSVVGSQNYRSPEMISGTHTSATDVWSYGCLLYEMLTQKTVDLAFDLVRAENKEAKLQELRNDILTQDLYGTEFADLVVSTLNLKPEERPTIDEIMKLPLFSGIEPDHEHANEECVICLANPRSHACVPCGHKVLCGEDCVAMVMQMGRCPICRTPVTHCMRIYE
jgi:serine/threonine protein kinase